MYNFNLEKLEYYRILNNLSQFCQTFLGKDLVKNLLPSNKKEDVQNILEETNEAVNLIDRISTPPNLEIENITFYIKALENGSGLTPKGLLDIANILEISNNLKEYFSEIENKDDFEILNNYFSCLYTNNSIFAKIKSSIIDENTISDSSSQTLANIRRKKSKLEQDIKNTLMNIVHSSKYSKYIQESVVTLRNDRYVIPVKQEYRSLIKGFIHDYSSTGSTVFIEPLSVFELNNELNNLKNEENIEIEKILFNLSGLLFPYTEEFKCNMQTIGKLDFIFAKAHYSKYINGICPIISKTKSINLINAKHPLIDPKKVVPISINLGMDFKLLVITGPNTGGKTVTLKTVGLLELMACSGLNIPCDEKSSIYVFDNIFADIGDDQSIADSLSTFSSHILNISNILKNATQNSLILLDELGSGTDPLEGAALATSILEYLKNNDILTIATTHYQELKQYAILNKDTQNASVEFDLETLTPTYKLLLGIPGKSNAFAISKKLGIDENIIEYASSIIDKKDVDIENLLKTIYDDKIKIEKQKEETLKELNQVSLLKKNLQKDNEHLKNKERELINNAKIKAREILLDAKKEAEFIISEIKQIQKDSTDINKMISLKNKLNSSIKETILINTNENIALNPIDQSKITIGSKVYVTNFMQNGTILSLPNKNNEVQIQIGTIKTKINIKYLELPKKELAIENTKTFAKISKTKTASSEINVIGLNIDQALPLVDKFIDDCILAKLPTARIVHGKGTGKLRQAIHTYLKNNKRVKSFRIGTFGEGEMGVTVIEL